MRLDVWLPAPCSGLHAQYCVHWTEAFSMQDSWWSWTGHDPPFDMEEIGEQVAAFVGSADEFWLDLATGLSFRTAWHSPRLHGPILGRLLTG